MTEERLAAVIAGELTGSARSQTAVNDIAFALVLDLHQPAGNLDDLRRTGPWAAADILHAIDRIPRSLWPTKTPAAFSFRCPGRCSRTSPHPGFQRRPLRHRPGRRGPRRRGVAPPRPRPGWFGAFAGPAPSSLAR